MKKAKTMKKAKIIKKNAFRMMV